MDLHEKLNEVVGNIADLSKQMEKDKANLKTLKRTEKAYLKLIEGAKALEK